MSLSPPRIGAPELADWVRRGWPTLLSQLTQLGLMDPAAAGRLRDTIVADLQALALDQPAASAPEERFPTERYSSSVGAGGNRFSASGGNVHQYPNPRALAEIDADIIQLLQGGGEPVTTEALEAAISEMQHEITRQALVLRVHRLARNGIVNSVRKGHYELTPHGALMAAQLEHSANSRAKGESGSKSTSAQER